MQLRLVPIGREAFVFLTSSRNPVTSLTLQQIRGIYAGDYTFWSQLGGPHTPILPLQRAEGSGSQSAFLSFMEGQPTKKNYLGFLGAAIGFSFRFYVEDVVANGNVRMLAVDGVYPDLEGVTSGGYPLVSEFYAVYDAANDNPNIPLLIDWFLSEQGQDIIEMCIRDRTTSRCPRSSARCMRRAAGSLSRAAGWSTSFAPLPAATPRSFTATPFPRQPP